MLKSGPDRYGSVAVSIHWITAVLILALLVTGFRAGGALDSAAKATFLRVHIPVAVVVLLLTVLRVLWWWRFDAKPLGVRGSPVWQERLARAVHVAFYLVILGMVASGIGMLVLSGAAPNIFGGSGALPDFHDYPPRLPHGLGADILIALLAAHVGAALHHHFIRRDGLIQRMWY